MLAAGAAMIMVAGATWILAKAFQEFASINFKGFMYGIIAMAALTGAVVALGILMSSGVGTIAILAGAAAMVIMAGAMWVLGDAMQKIADSADGVDKVMTTLAKTDAAHILALATAFSGLGMGMSAFAVGSTLLAGTGALLGALGLGGKESKGAEKNPVEEKLDLVVQRLDTLTETLRKKEFVTNLDGRAVSRNLNKSIAYGT